MSIRLTNNAVSKLAGSLTAGTTSFSVTATEGAKFPAIASGEVFPCTLIKIVGSEPVYEIIKVTARAVDTFTVERGQEGTTATTFSAGDVIELRWTAKTGESALDIKGANIASAATVDLNAATGDFIHITGTTTITAITLDSGLERDVVFDGVLTLTHNGTSLILPGNVNITTAAGDRATFRGEGSGNVRCMHYTKADGTPVVAPAVTPSAMVLIGSPVVASAASTVDIETTFDSTYDEYEIRITGLTASAVSILKARLKVGGAYDTGANYSFHASRPNSSSTSYVGAVGASVTAVDIYNNGFNGAGNSLDLVVRVHLPSGTSLKKKIDWSGGAIDASGNAISLTGAGLNTGTGALTGIRFFPDAGTISGTFRLYGIKKS